MASSAEQLAEDLLQQIRDDAATVSETINHLRAQLQNEVARNVRLTFEVERLNQTIRQLMRDVNGEG